MANNVATQVDQASEQTPEKPIDPSNILTPQPRKVAIWFEGEQDFDLLPFIFFVASANAAQQSFQFYFPDPPDELTYEIAKSHMEANETIFITRKYDVYVFITSEHMRGNLFL
jgi:hypothetical protein